MHRRALQFHDLDEVAREVQRLHTGGYDQVGRWDLAQVCNHLADWMSFPQAGFPQAGPLPVRAMLWSLRNTVGRRMLRKILARQAMPPGGATIRETVHPPGGDESGAVERLRSTVRRFRAHAGPWHPSPLFGELTGDEWEQLQLVHCAHHLSFLIPRGT
jgi:hypothetical protein